MACLPPELAGESIFEPGDEGWEKRIRERLAELAARRRAREREMEMGAVAAPWPLVATCSRGLEEVLRQELWPRPRRGRRRPGHGRLRGDLAAVYRANLCLRTAMRVLRPSPRGRRRAARSSTSSPPGCPGRRCSRRADVRRRVSRARERVSSSAFAALTVKDAVVDRLRDRWGTRPDVARASPDVLVHLHLADDRADSRSTARASRCRTAAIDRAAVRRRSPRHSPPACCCSPATTGRNRSSTRCPAPARSRSRPR